jgi:hypothetical protein
VPKPFHPIVAPGAVVVIVAVGVLSASVAASSAAARDHARSSSASGVSVVEGSGGGPGGAWIGPSGVTATGRATFTRGGSAARDAAIRTAVADAREQADVAARAAGGSLGSATAIDVADGPFPYPLEVAGSAEVPTAGAGSTSSGPPACLSGTPCPSPTSVPIRPVRVVMALSVTVTWSRS